MRCFEEELSSIDIDEFDCVSDYLVNVKSRISCSLEDLEYIDGEIIRAIGIDLRLKFMSKIINKASFVFGLYDEKMYDEDIKILNQHKKLVANFSNCFTILNDIIDDNNCRDVLRLAIYTEMKFCDNHEYYIGKGEEYILSCGGINCDMNGECDQNEFLEFFNRKVEELKTVNSCDGQKVMIKS